MSLIPRFLADRLRRRPKFIGCSTDPKYVEMTCAMLSSVDDSGDVAEATVLVSDFGLEQKDRDVLRASAGQLGRRMRFISITRDSSKIVALPDFDFPLPMIGKLLIPGEVTNLRGRMITLDSDIIVNSSLRPLFDLDLQGHPLAAVHNPLVDSELKKMGRDPDPDFFNNGMLIIDTGAFNAQKLCDRSLRWLAACNECPPWPDNDALCQVVGGDWLRLDRCWNLFYAGEERQFTYEEYAAAPIVHFAGAKPSTSPHHPAFPLYKHQVDRAAAKIAAVQLAA